MSATEGGEGGGDGRSPPDPVTPADQERVVPPLVTLDSDDDDDMGGHVPVIISSEDLQKRRERATGPRSYSRVVSGPGRTPPRSTPPGGLQLQGCEFNADGTLTGIGQSRDYKPANPFSMSSYVDGLMNDNIDQFSGEGVGSQSRAQAAGGAMDKSHPSQMTSTPTNPDKGVNPNFNNSPIKKINFNPAVVTQSVTGNDKQDKRKGAFNLHAGNMERKRQYLIENQGWKRAGKTFLMENKDGVQKPMSKFQKTFFKEYDRREADINERKALRQMKEQNRRERAQDRLRKPAETVTNANKRNMSDRSDPSLQQQEAKKQKENDESKENKGQKTPEQINEDIQEERFWSQPENKALTVKIVTDRLDKVVTDEDISYINSFHLRSVEDAAKRPDGSFDYNILRLYGSSRLGRAGSHVRMKLDTKQGIKWFKRLIAGIPPRIEGPDGYGYIFLKPGETRFAHFQGFVQNPDLVGDGAMSVFSHFLRAWNPEMEKVSFFVKVVRMIQESQRVVIKLMIPHSEVHVLSSLNFRLKYGIERILFTPMIYPTGPGKLNERIVDEQSSPPLESKSKEDGATHTPSDQDAEMQDAEKLNSQQIDEDMLETVDPAEEEKPKETVLETDLNLLDLSHDSFASTEDNYAVDCLYEEESEVNPTQGAATPTESKD